LRSAAACKHHDYCRCAERATTKAEINHLATPFDALTVRRRGTPACLFKLRSQARAIHEEEGFFARHAHTK
jgi:hypothetical protein